MIKPQNKKNALKKELLFIERKEKKMETAAKKAGTARWKGALEEKVPKKVYTGLQSAFQKAFSLVLKKGTILIEKSYHKDTLQKEHMIRDYALKIKGSKKEIKQLNKSAKKADAFNCTLTTIEGVGLGALGIGLPDIVMFLGVLLKGIYETALHYGCDYDSKWEQLWI